MGKLTLISRDFWRCALFVAVLFLAQNAYAYTAPASGSFAFDVYDLAVNKILEGPIGFVGGVMAIVLGAVFAVRADLMKAIPAILGGAMIIKAESIVTSLGVLF